MRIKDKTQFTLGIFNILLAIAGTIILIAQRRTQRLPFLVICFICGIIGVLNGVERKGRF